MIRGDIEIQPVAGIREVALSRPPPGTDESTVDPDVAGHDVEVVQIETLSGDHAVGTLRPKPVQHRGPEVRRPPRIGHARWGSTLLQHIIVEVSRERNPVSHRDLYIERAEAGLVVIGVHIGPSGGDGLFLVREISRYSICGIRRDHQHLKLTGRGQLVGRCRSLVLGAAQWHAETVTLEEDRRPILTGAGGRPVENLEIVGDRIGAAVHLYRDSPAFGADSNQGLQLGRAGSDDLGRHGADHDMVVLPLLAEAGSRDSHQGARIAGQWGDGVDGGQAANSWVACPAAGHHATSRDRCDPDTECEFPTSLHCDVLLID